MNWPPHWYFDEAAHAGAEHLDASQVAAYDAKAQVDPSADLELLQGLGLNEGSHLLDLGAGTGVLAVAAAQLGAQVTAVDISPAMLEVVRQRAATAGVTLRTVQAGLLTIHLDQQYDFLYCRNALHHLSDFWKALALRRMHDALKPGGTLVLRDLIYTFEPAEAPERLERWLAGAPAAPGGYDRADLETHIRSEYSTFSWLLEPLLTHCGFRFRPTPDPASSVFAGYLCTRLENSLD